jgi:RNA ligase
MACRGLVLNSQGKIISKPFKKFFNYEELDSLGLKIPVGESFRTLTKYDGSFVQVFKYKEEMIVTTRGSFYSDQAIWAEKWLLEHFSTIQIEYFDEIGVPWYYYIKSGYTYCFEVIYKSNRIVIDYKDFEGLVLLGTMNSTTNYGELGECSFDHTKWVSEITGIPLAESHPYQNLKELFEAQKNLSANEEGFVITYDSGFMFKLKGEAYCKIHRMLSNLTPLAFWRALDLELGMIPSDYLEALPEEFRKHSDFLKVTIEDLYNKRLNKVIEIVDKIFQMSFGSTRERYEFLSKAYPEDYCLVLNILNGKLNKTQEMIYRDIRPLGNKFKDMELDKDLKKIVENFG